MGISASPVALGDSARGDLLGHWPRWLHVLLCAIRDGMLLLLGAPKTLLGRDLNISFPPQAGESHSHRAADGKAGAFSDFAGCFDFPSLVEKSSLCTC